MEFARCPFLYRAYDASIANGGGESWWRGRCKSAARERWPAELVMLWGYKKRRLQAIRQGFSSFGPFWETPERVCPLHRRNGGGRLCGRHE
jgi:hypothetical protein